MKKFVYILSAVVLAAGCNFLDFDESSSDYTREDMYKTYSNIQKMLTNIYGYMPNKDIADVSSALRDCGSDDAEYADLDASVQRFTNGNWSALQTVDSKWDLYNAIRCANEFLESMKTVDISMYRYDTKYFSWMEHLRVYPYEARILRAYYFFELARRYGDIPMPVDVMLTAEEANEIAKTSFNDVIDFIVSECDASLNATYNDTTYNSAGEMQVATHPVLPVTYVGMLDDEIGRVTRGFAMAVKTKALLYAASPLHNASGDTEKWRKAAQAAKDMIDATESDDKERKLPYKLDKAEKANNYLSSEVIMAILRSESSSFEKYNFPVRFTEGQRTSIAGNYPTQNLVDAFQTLKGNDITLTANGWKCNEEGFDLTKPYEGRDPRFARAILANGMAFKKSTIETFVGGKDYSATRSDLGTPTGYYLRKYIQEETSFTPEASSSYKHQWIVYRYAEVLLTYAEAVNEYFKDPTKTDETFTMSAQTALNLIRANAGMPDVDVTDYAAFQEAVRREWRVEFAFEDHRFWDVRRWNIGQATQGQVDGVEIVKNGSSYTYSRKTVRTRTWAARQNLYPIPQSELFCNPNLNPQNTGW